MVLKELNIPEIGPVEFIRSSGYRSIRITVQPFSPVSVSVPANCDIVTAEKFLATKINWLKKVIAKKNLQESKLTIFTNETQFHTKEHTLIISSENRKNINISVKNGFIKILYPSGVDPRHPLVQQCARKGIEEAWRIEAQKHLPDRLIELSKTYNLPFRSVSVRNSKTRWGSCSPDNKITLSIHLIRLPQHLIDYVLVHELVHTIHKNHSNTYHAAFQKLIPEEKILSKELRKYNINIY